MMKVSVTADTVRKRQCLNIRQQAKPIMMPIEIDTMASVKNWAMIKNGV
jgi:hypothetical protein